MKKNGTIISLVRSVTATRHTCCRLKKGCKDEVLVSEGEPKRFSYSMLEVIQM